MRREDEAGLWILVGIWLLAKLDNPISRADRALKDAGARAWERANPDRTYDKDVPQKPLSKQSIMQLAAAIGFPDPKLAAAIAMAESGGVPNALGDLRDGSFISVGLWQINIEAHPQFSFDAMKDPRENALAAYHISKAGTDWRPWSTWWLDPVNKIGPGMGSYRGFM